MSVMFLNHFHIVAHPLRDLEDRAASACEQARKGVAHDVGRDPRASLPLHVLGEGSFEVVSVAAAALLGVGGDDVGLLQFEFLQKSTECRRERDRALLAILEGDSSVLGQVQQARLQVEPLGLGLNNFIFPQTSMKSTKQNIFKLCVPALSDQAVAKLGAAEFFSNARLRGLDLLFAPARRQRDHGVRGAGAFDLGAPVEKTLNGHQVPVSRARLDALAAHVVVGSHVLRRDFGGRNPSRPFRPLAQHATLRLQRRLRPVACAHAERSVIIDRELKVGAIAQNLRSVKRGDLFNGLEGVVSLQGHEIPLAVELAGIPVKGPALVETLHFDRRCGAGLGLRRFSGRCSHKSVTISLSHFAVTLSSSVWGRMGLYGLGEWCAVQGSNLWPLPCQDGKSVGNVTLPCNTGFFFASGTTANVTLFGGVAL
jgi:hypothetical protein